MNEKSIKFEKDDNALASFINLQDECEHDDDEQGERKDDLSALVNGEVAVIFLKSSV